MARAALLLCLGAALAASGCNKPKSAAADGAAIQKQEAERAAREAKLQGWTRVFAGTETTIAIANQFGYRNGPYAPVKGGTGYRSTGARPTIANSFAARPSATDFVAEGAGPNRIDALHFGLDITDETSVAKTKKRFRDILNAFLIQFKIDIGDDIMALVTAETKDSKSYPGAIVSIEKLPLADGPPKSRRLVVTFAPDGASAPANTEAQGK